MSTGCASAVTVWHARSAVTPGAGAVHDRQVQRRLVRSILGGVLGRDPAALRFDTRPGGKPTLVEPFAHAPRGGCELHFNVSHTGDHVFVAMSCAGPVGIDAEQSRPLFDPDAVAARALAPMERSALGRLRPADRHAAVLRAWTRKEALLKGDGIGLARPPASLQVDLDPATRSTAGSTGSTGSTAVRPLLHSAGWPWHLYDLTGDDEVIVALATWGQARIVRHRWPRDGGSEPRLVPQGC